jgi:hypothetical protein
MALRRIAAAWAGPLSIVGLVLFALRGFAFAHRLTNEHPDLLTFWLPRWAYLGRAVAALHVPAWNPYEMLGYRFAADPQSGWLYAPPMLLFGLLGPGTAMRAMIVLNPLIAGLGLSAFLRIEGLSRFAATIGGLSIAAMISTSEIAISLPFAGFLAWTTVTLVGAAGFAHARTWSRRLAWLALAAFGWSQVASAHLSHGLVMCSLVVLAYLLAAFVRAVRAGQLAWRSAAVHVTVFVVVTLAAALAVVVPRLDLIEASSLRNGYAGAGRVAPGAGAEPIQTNGVWAGWPLALGSAPGAYAGSIVLLGVPLALRARRRRALVVAFGVSFAIGYDLMLNAAVTGRTGELIATLPYGDVFMHNPGRLRYLAVLAAPVLGAVGVQGLRDDPAPLHRLVPWFAAGVALWIGVPIAAGADLVRWQLLAIVVLPATLALIALGRVPSASSTPDERIGAGWSRRSVGRLVPIGVIALLICELVASAVMSGRFTGDTVLLGLEGGRSPNIVPQPLRAPDLDETAFLRRTALVDRIGGDRYLTWSPPAAAYEKGYLFAQEPTDWPALTMERGTLFGIRDVLGYNPVQLARYWTWIRVANRLPLFYNASSIQLPTDRDIDLMGVRYLIVPHRVRPPVAGRVVTTADGYDLVEVRDPPAMATVVPDWSSVKSPTEAFTAVGWAGFDPSVLVSIEGKPGLQRQTAAQAGTATYQELSATDVRIHADAAAPSIVLVRNAFDDGWEATVDARPTPILPANGFLQGVPVGAGNHDIRLTFRDRSVALGLWLGGAAWLALAAAIAVAAALERRRRRPDTPAT